MKDNKEYSKELDNLNIPLDDLINILNHYKYIIVKQPKYKKYHSLYDFVSVVREWNSYHPKKATKEKEVAHNE